jgi:hypothetical protein
MRKVLGRGKVSKMFGVEPQENRTLVKPKHIWEEILE